MPAVAGLTPRELQVVDCAARGMTDKETAVALGVTTKTIYTHWERARLKLGCVSRAHVVASVMLSYLDVCHSELAKFRGEPNPKPGRIDLIELAARVNRGSSLALVK